MSEIGVVANSEHAWFDLSGEVIEKKGGHCLQCLDDVGPYGRNIFCYPCEFASAIEDAGEGEFKLYLCLQLDFLSPKFSVIPCIAPWFMAEVRERINKKLGGRENFANNLLCSYCCPALTACQFTRAIKKSLADGSLTRNRGNPIVNSTMRRDYEQI